MDISKNSVARAALKCLSHGKIIGIGSGTTIHRLISLLPESGLSNLKVVPTSLDTLNRLQSNPQKNYEIIELPDNGLDITIDGADRVNPEKQALKGGGGALTREKIVREASKKFILIVNNNKVIPKLGGFPIAVEIIPFGWKHTVRRLGSLTGNAKVRIAHNKLGPVISDNNCYIVDIDLGNRTLDPIEVSELEQSINEIPGVIENGLFSHPADKVIVGYPSGKITSY
ncbi:MAG: ribose-5-phosphate isomerase RpiA [Candidatus Hodarchaeota archaeon]